MIRCLTHKNLFVPLALLFSLYEWLTWPRNSINAMPPFAMSACIEGFHANVWFVSLGLKHRDLLTLSKYPTAILLESYSLWCFNLSVYAWYCSCGNCFATWRSIVVIFCYNDIYWCLGYHCSICCIALNISTWLSIFITTSTVIVRV